MDIAQLRLIFEEVEAPEPANDEVSAPLVARTRYMAGDVRGALEALDILARADDSDDTRETVLEIVRVAVEDADSVASSIGW